MGFRGWIVLVVVLAAAAPVAAQERSRSYALDESGAWVETEAPEAGSDKAFMAEMRTLIAEGHPAPAQARLNDWIREHKKTDNPYLSTAYLLRGDARAAAGYEYRALYDYERVIRDFPSSPDFVTAVERELAIAIAYVHGMRRRAFGLRISSARGTGEKLLLLVDERMPFSQLAETAGIELADYYFRRGDLEFADMAYELFLRFYPRSRFRKHALLHRVYSSVGQFKGPKYDATMLTDAELLIEDFQAEYPLEAERKGLDGLLARINEGKAAQKLDKARWYIKRGDKPSAKFMYKRIVRDHPTTLAAQAAIDEMTRRGWFEAEGAEEPAADERAIEGRGEEPAPQGAGATDEETPE